VKVKNTEVQHNEGQKEFIPSPSQSKWLVVTIIRF
jgi:hypothetical protein